MLIHASPLPKTKNLLLILTFRTIKYWSFQKVSLIFVIMEVIGQERIILSINFGFGDRRTSLQEPCDLFNDTFSGRITKISKSIVLKN